MPTVIVGELLTILASGLVASLVCRRLGVSVLVGYLLVGAVIGRGGLGWVDQDRHEIEYLAEAGVFLLLFAIGLEFSLGELARLGRNLLIGGSVQMLLFAAPAGAVLLASGFSWQASVLLAAALAFSSTVLVFKVLSEWGHSSSPHGRRAIGILLFQDAALVPLLLLIPLLTDAGPAAGAVDYLILALVSIGFILAVILVQRLLATVVIPRLAGYRSPELVVLFTIVALGAITLSAYSIGLPPAVGAFAGGLVFSGNRWTHQIDALLLPFRETFSAVFFVSLGMLFDPQLLWSEPLLLVGTLAGLIIVKAAAATIALLLTGLSWRGAAGMGIGLAHVGEFAFVLMLLGWEAEIISQSAYQWMITLAIGSLILTPLLLKKGLRWAQTADAADDASHVVGSHVFDGTEAIVVGAGPIGRQVASQLETIGRDVCLIDLSPINLHRFASEGFRTVAGDATDASTLNRANAPNASLAVVCVPDDTVAIRIVRAIREQNPTCFLLVRCRYQDTAPKLSKAGANRTISEEAEVGNVLLRALADR